MEFVEGPVLRSRAEAEEHFDADERHAIGERVADTLVAIHGVDPDAVGLGELGRKQDYVERQLRALARAVGEVQDARARGRRRRPPPARGADPRPGPGDDRPRRLPPRQHDPRASSGEVAAVVDWELCTLGDPLADVGLLMVYWSEAGDELIPLFDPPTVAAGFPTRDEIRDRYAERSGRDLSQLDFYVALGYWKLAIILEGVYARYAAGQYGKPDEGFEEFAKIVERLAEGADEAERRLG